MEKERAGAHPGSVSRRGGMIWRSLKRQSVSPTAQTPASDPDSVPLDLDRALDEIQALIDLREGVSVKRLSSGPARAALLFIDFLTDKLRLEQSVLRPLLAEFRKTPSDAQSAAVTPEQVLTEFVPGIDSSEALDIPSVCWALLDGYSVLLAGGWGRALTFNTTAVVGRQIGSPEVEVSLKGPREAFVEHLDLNLGLVRQKLRHPRFRVANVVCGRYSRTRVAVVYVQGLARSELVREVMSRVRRIDVDAALDATVVSEFIEDCPLSPFPQIGSTERPDRVSLSLLQGRVAILVDGSPYALIVPFPMLGFLQVSEDYYQRWVTTVLTRTLRLLSAATALLMPSLYVAFTTFHQEVIPRPLVLAIASQRDAVPYPAIVEALLLTFVFEVVVEATLRLPRLMGPTIGIVGTLVIGESAVRANLVSNIMVIVVAMTAIAQFTVLYDLSVAIRLLRLPILLLASAMGLFGVFFGLILIILHLANLRSFGVPYLAPYAPLILTDMKDATIRMPWWTQTTRPQTVGVRNIFAAAPGQKPGPSGTPAPEDELETATPSSGAPKPKDPSSDPPPATDETWKDRRPR